MSISVPFEELVGSGQNRFDDNGGAAVRLLLCDYADADLLCAELLGSAQPIGAASQIRTAPNRHPRRPYLYCRSAQYEGLAVNGTGPDGLISYRKARVTAEYRPLDLVDGQNTLFITEQRQFGVQTESVTTSPFFWDEGSGDAVGLQRGLALLVPQLTVSITIHQWFNAPVGSGLFETLIGRVNGSDFRALWTNWPRRTLLFEGAQVERQFTSAGLSAWRVGLRFRFRPVGWNALYNPLTGEYSNIATAEGITPYRDADFHSLLP